MVSESVKQRPRSAWICTERPVISLTSSNHRPFFQNHFKDLDELAHGLRAKLEALRDRLETLPESFAIRVEQVSRTAEEIRERLRSLANELGRESLAYSDRLSLEGVVDALLIALDDRGQVCERLQRIADQLEAGQFSHKIKATAAKLNAVRQHAAAELRQASQTPRVGLLQGPEDSSDWLTWAWQLEPHRLEQLMEQLQTLYPNLVTVP